MSAHRGFAIDSLRRVRWSAGVPVGLCIGLLLALCVNEACAAALGSLATSVGLFATLAALFVIKGWPAHWPSAALSTAGAALAVAGAAAWLGRTRAAERPAGLVGDARSPGRRALPGAGRQNRPAAIVLPVGVHHEALLADLRGHFLRVQHAWDHGQMPALRALTTPEMLDELCREQPGCTDSYRTEVVTLRAELLGFEALAQALVVSVEFSGLIRETAEAGAVPFRELWMLTQSKHETSGWRLARHQALL